MNDLPRGPLQPLPAPPGAFESVTRRARARRMRTALVSTGLGLALAGAGVVALPSGNPSTPDRLVPAGPSITPSVQPSPPTPTPTASPSPTATAPPQGRLTTYTARVVDQAGRPLSGIYVARFAPGNTHADEHDVQTGPDGTFTTGCGGKLMFSTWLTGAEQWPGTRNLALRWLDGETFENTQPAPCYLGGQQPGRRDIVMRPGAVLEGDVDFNGVPRTGETLSFGLMCGPELGVGLQGTLCAAWPSAGSHYRLVGLPAGTFALRSSRGADQVTVTLGTTTRRDWYECAQCSDGRAHE